MRDIGHRGFSIIELLVALAMMAVVSAALLPAIALAARLQRESAIETESATIAAAALERVKARMPAVSAPGGSLDGRVAGWHVLVNREGVEVSEAGAAYECRWRIARLDAPAGVVVLSVRVLPLGVAHQALTIATVVRDE